jgi:hypothetical protein
MMLTWDLKGKIVDIETAFLHGNLKETIYMEIPIGMEAHENKCLILKKKIYGLVQSARKRMRFSRKHRRSMPLDEIYGTWNCIYWNLR